MHIDPKEMTQLEKLHAMENLWDSLHEDGDTLASPEWHDEILAERRRILRDESTELLGLEDLKTRR